MIACSFTVPPLKKIKCLLLTTITNITLLVKVGYVLHDALSRGS